MSALGLHAVLVCAGVHCVEVPELVVGGSRACRAAGVRRGDSWVLSSRRLSAETVQGWPVDDRHRRRRLSMRWIWTTSLLTGHHHDSVVGIIIVIDNCSWTDRKPLPWLINCSLLIVWHLSFITGSLICVQCPCRLQHSWCDSVTIISPLVLVIIIIVGFGMA